ncbi:MAG TPA: protein kinase, partial [Gemmatales bacterium]|nr:protein kinase [Gemmatales bacterium]
MPDKNDLFAQYQILEDLGDFPTYSLFKVKAPNSSIKLWKKIDLQFNAASIETRLLPVIEKVQHPNLNAVSNSFLFQDKGLLFVESDFPVKTLRHRLEELKSTGSSGIPISELIGYMAQVAEAIDFLNAPMHPYQGKKIAIYHRALSPDSLHLFEEKGKIICKLGDFGLAKPIIDSNDAARHSLGLTNYDYAPPEFDEGLTTNTSDQYSLATTYVELRTGKLPFTGTLLQKLQAQLNGTPDLSLLEPNERPVVSRALNRDPHARFPSCKEFVKQLQLALGGVVSIPIFSGTGAGKGAAMT